MISLPPEAAIDTHLRPFAGRSGLDALDALDPYEKSLRVAGFDEDWVFAFEPSQPKVIQVLAWKPGDSDVVV